MISNLIFRSKFGTANAQGTGGKLTNAKITIVKHKNTRPHNFNDYKKLKENISSLKKDEQKGQCADRGVGKLVGPGAMAIGGREGVREASASNRTREEKIFHRRTRQSSTRPSRAAVLRRRVEALMALRPSSIPTSIQALDLLSHLN
ncbi:glutamyl-tRNA reductase [Striga asiatica]|uniref:Glutamyl-tRNA reductase n=1 Tax=Striga asiatica TaxID=4170 RepID=A0A5A7PMX0_STRAF|nr:glutamyl-tRNA reductase [Striga asiatica]